jgi:hypothetical protein
VTQSGPLVDWTADGRYLVVGEPTSDSLFRLSALAISDGVPTGERVNLRSVPGNAARTTPDGSLIVRPATTSNREVSLGVLDASEKSIQWTSLNLIGNPVPTAFAAWSPDNSRFAYLSAEPPSTVRTVRVKDPVRGDDRELYRDERLLGCVWAHTKPVLFCSRPPEILTVSLDTGRAEVVATLPEPFMVDHISPDDRLLYGVRTLAEWGEWDFARNQLTRVSFFRSPDRRWSFRFSNSGGGMEIRPAEGSDSDWKVVASRRMTRATNNGAIPIRFSPDGNWLIYHDQSPEGKDGLYRVSTSDAGEAERIGDYPTNAFSSVLTVSQDGRKFIVNAPRQRVPEMWALENFLPAASATNGVGTRAPK